MTAPVSFYDVADVQPASNGWLDIERIYCFAWDAFSTEDMRRLGEIFQSLPQWKHEDARGCHWWYAENEDPDHGYLTASIEPPGLQVFGSLQYTDWVAWDGMFRERASKLPTRSP